MSSTFKFKPIYRSRNEIRLVELLPGKRDDTICCNSRVQSLNGKPEYQALSYVWGDPDFTDTIKLDGESFNVSRNLLSALKNLRTEHKSQTLWIDALCIDQQNEFEKAWQVNLMGKIFKDCTKGLLWVGDESEQSDAWCITNFPHYCTHATSKQYFDTVSPSWAIRHPEIQLAAEDHQSAAKRFDREKNHCKFSENKTYRYSSSRWHGVRPRTSTLLELVDLLEKNKHLDEILALRHAFRPSHMLTFGSIEPLIALGAFMNRSWWTRMWTVQEAALPPTSVLCWGQSRCSFDKMASSAENLYVHSQTCCSRFFTALIQRLEDLSCGEATVNALFNFQKHLHTLDLTRSWVKNNVTINLMDCLNNFHDRESKDPRDKIFALLGLLPPGFRCSVDYQMETQTLYENMSFLLLNSYPDRTLSVLWRESWPPKSVSSWVKNFDEMTKAFNRRARSEHYDASNGRPVQVQRQNASVLSVLGTQVGIVSKLTPNFHVASTYSRNQFSTFRDWAQFLDLNHRHDHPYSGQSTLFDAFGRTLTGDLLALDPTYPGFNEEDLEWFIQSLLEEELEDDLIDAALAQELNTSAAERRLFVTQQGLIGLGPKWMQPEDEVWILFGGSVPFILRPLEAGDVEGGYHTSRSHIKYYSVIGDCYVHGIMFGEAAEAPVKEQVVFLK